MRKLLFFAFIVLAGVVSAHFVLIPLRLVSNQVSWEKASNEPSRRESRKIDEGVRPDHLRPSSNELCRAKFLRSGVVVPARALCVDIDTLVENLATGVYRFNKPEVAYVEEPFRLILLLETNTGQDVTRAFRSVEGRIVQRHAKLAQNLEATLRGGADFKVEPPGPQQRTVTSQAPVIWEWSVTPLRPGTRTIALDVGADLIIGSAKNHVQLRTLYEEIEIQVRMFHYLKSAFSGFYGIAVGLATLVIAILGIMHYVKGLRRKRREDHDEPPPIEIVTHSASDHSDHPAGH